MMGLPLTRTWSFGATRWPIWAGSPLTDTRPATINSSISRREPMPASASTLCSLGMTESLFRYLPRRCSMRSAESRYARACSASCSPPRGVRRLDRSGGGHGLLTLGSRRLLGRGVAATAAKRRPQLAPTPTGAGLTFGCRLARGGRFRLTVGNGVIRTGIVVLHCCIRCHWDSSEFQTWVGLPGASSSSSGDADSRSAPGRSGSASSDAVKAASGSGRTRSSRPMAGSCPAAPGAA